MFFVQCGRNIVDNAIYHLSTAPSVPEIFVVKFHHVIKTSRGKVWGLFPLAPKF